MTDSPPRQVRTRTVRYHHDIGLLLDHLGSQGLIPTVAGDRQVRPVDTVLLESVDIATKVSRTTIALLQCAARLTCDGDRVRVESLPQARSDGREAITRLRGALGQYEVAPEQTVREQGRAHSAEATRDDLLTLSIPALCRDDLEERERLRAPSTALPLRVLADGQVDHPHLPLVSGVLAFDYLATIESLPPVPQGPNTCPDYLFYDARIILVIDHPTRQATLVGASVDVEDLEAQIGVLAAAIDSAVLAEASASAGEGAASAAGAAGAAPIVHARPNQSDQDFAASVARLKESIDAGDVYQVVPSRGFTMDCPHGLGAYHELRRSNPSPYMFYLGAPGFELLGASPESALLHSATTGQVSIRPIAGTRPRGLRPDGSVDHERDTRLELELRTDAKEVAEHVMLVDLARNDVARVSVPGTRHVSTLLRVDRYSRVMHLVSEVTGRLADDLDALDALRASLTMGTLTGAPKLRAAELIRQVEGVRRGSYGGTVGYLRGDGELDTCIVIRSAFVADGQALVQAGAGVVCDSVPAAEAAETVHKASAVLQAVAAAQGARLVIDSETTQGA